MPTQRRLLRHTLAFALVALLALIAIAPMGAQDASPNPDALQGAALFEAGDYEAAYVPLRRAAFADPFDNETLRRYLFSLVYAGRYGDIEFPYNILSLRAPEILEQLAAQAAELAETAPNDVHAAAVNAFFAADGPSDTATQRSAIDRLLALDPNHPFAYDVLAYIAFYAGDAEGGREPAERALALAPEDPHIIVDLALPFAWALNEPDRALELLTQAITLDPMMAEAYADRAFVYANFLGDVDSALLDYERAIELEPRNFGYRMMRGFVNLRSEDYSAAQADFVAVLEMLPALADPIVGLVNVALATETSIDLILEHRDLVEADAALTSEVPYSGDMTSRRIVQLPISVEPGEYTVTVRADDPMSLDTMLIITNGDNIALAYNDDLDGQGAREEGAFNSQVTWTAEEGVSYIAYVLHAGAGSEGAFIVTLERATP